MHVQDIHGTRPDTSGAEGAGEPDTTPASAPGDRAAQLRVDARRNLQHILRAAREVFGEAGYGAPMEDVARRARVGVGTVYRRFPSKDVLVRRIAQEETARLTDQARAALGQEDEPWQALSRFLRTSVASGAGRLLPPHILRSDTSDSTVPAHGIGPARVPQQRQAQETGGAVLPPAGPWLIEQRTPPEAERTAPRTETTAADDEPGTTELLGLVGRLVQRASEADALRSDVTVGDVLLVIATAAPTLPDADQQAAASSRLLDILLEGLRPHLPH